MFKKKANYIRAEVIGDKVYLDANISEDADINQILSLVSVLQNKEALLNTFGRVIKSPEKLEKVKEALLPINIPLPFPRFRDPAIRPNSVIKNFISHLKGE